VGREERREQAGVKIRPAQQNNDTNCPGNQSEGLECRLYCKGLALTKVFGYSTVYKSYYYIRSLLSNIKLCFSILVFTHFYFSIYLIGLNLGLGLQIDT